MNAKVWIVTGASKGLGKTLAMELLNRGEKVAATSRTVKALTAEFGAESDQFLPLQMDLTTESNVSQQIHRVQKKWGRIDVLVNNAGYGQFGAVEEVSDELARENFNVNVFGLLNVTRQTLPFMRAQRSGHIINISSIGGYVGGFPGVGVYCASKFAVAGLSEGLSAELAPLGIKVTLVYPGYFRTEFLSSESMADADRTINDYEEARAMVKQHAAVINNNQPGDPKKAAIAMINAAREEKSPLHLFLGKDSYEMAFKKIDAVKAELDTWSQVSLSTDL